MSRPLLAVVLAAGKGTRMQSDLPKVLHKVAGRSMLGHVLALTDCVGATEVAVVVGPEMDAVRQAALAAKPSAKIFVQQQQFGTGHAVLSARDAIAAHQGDVIVLYSDTPLIEAETVRRLIAALDQGAAVAVLGFDKADPGGYGRLLVDGDGKLRGIREARDASPEELAITLCNSGVIAFRSEDLAGLLGRISNANVKGEYYLTDAVEIAVRDGAVARYVLCHPEDVLGVNSRVELAEVEAIWQRRARVRFMAEGVTMIAPDTVWLSFDTKIGRDTVIEPNVVIAPGVTIGANCEIKASCHFEGAVVGDGAKVGPFARLRPGAVLGADVHVGNFVEVKNVKMGKGAKANHLSYLGDGEVGTKANIGAGTIFCNYDGFFKHRTEIGEGAFVGSNSSLVAPVRIGAGAYVGSGSVITKDVSDGALALERSTQEERPGWAEKFRQMMLKRKAKA